MRDAAKTQPLFFIIQCVMFCVKGIDVFCVKGIDVFCVKGIDVLCSVLRDLSLRHHPATGFYSVNVHWASSEELALNTWLQTAASHRKRIDVFMYLVIQYSQYKAFL